MLLAAVEFGNLGGNQTIGAVAVEIAPLEVAISPLDRADVNSDGLLSALDALLVVNALNEPLRHAASIDVNGDDFLTDDDFYSIVDLISEELPPTDSVSAPLPSFARLRSAEPVSYFNIGFPGDRSDPEASARRFLSAAAPQLGIQTSETHLIATSVQHGLSSSHTQFQQLIDALPVYGAYVSVHQGGDGSIQTLHARHFARPAATSKAAPAIPRELAVRAATDHAAVTAYRLPTESELMWYPVSDDKLTRAWRVSIAAADPVGDFLSIVDSDSGELLLHEDQLRRLQGVGDIFLPNPVQSQGNRIGLSDSDDSAIESLNAQIVSVGLQGLDPDSGLLRGEFVDVSTLDSGLLPDVDADEPDRIYQYQRDDPRFEQVVIYSTIDSVQRYIHSLGFDDDQEFPTGIRDFPTLANAHWNHLDNSFYSTADDALHFGDGGVDDAEDADVIIHEYGHAIQFDQNPTWGADGEIGAMGEGFADYLAASFFAESGDRTYQSADAACIAEWDSTSFVGEPACLRRVDRNKIYPDSLVGQVHADGEVWSRALWDIRASLGGQPADKLILEHHFAVPPNATMPIAAQVMLATDANLNGGINESILRTAFVLRGILGPQPTPTAAAVATDIRTVGGVSQLIDVSFVDDAGVDPTKIGDGDLLVTGPNDFTQFATLVAVDSTSFGTRLSAEYSILAPGGRWGEEDNGVYTIQLVAGEVGDYAGNVMPTTSLGQFHADIRNRPVAKAAAPDITATKDNQSIVVNYTSSSGIDVSELGDGDIEVLGPNGFSVTATIVKVNNPTDGALRSASYEIAAPTGGWHEAHDGVYTIRSMAAEVFDVDGGELPSEDIGQFEIRFGSIPTAVASSSEIRSAGATSHTLTVTFSDDGGAINRSTIGNGDVLITGPAGFAELATLAELPPSANENSQIAQYAFEPPGGTWDEADNGTYTISMIEGEVSDLFANPVPAGKIGTFDVSVVNCTAPDGFGYRACAAGPRFEGIQSTGNRILDDSREDVFELTDELLGDFAFSFYGTKYKSLFVSTEGLITFGVPTATGNNTDLMSFPAAPSIAVYWDNLETERDADAIYWEVRGEGDDERLTIQWHNVDYNNDSGKITFQAILREVDGSILLNYVDLDDLTTPASEGGSATVGTKGSGVQGAHRLLAAFNNGPNAFVGSGQSTLISLEPVVALSVDQHELVEAGGMASLRVTLSEPAATPTTVELGFSGLAAVGDDYAVSETQLVIPAGATVASASITGLSDDIDEAEERLIIDIVNVTGASEAGVQRQAVRIRDDDEMPVAALAVGAAEMAESGEPIAVSVSLSHASGRPVVAVLDLGGTAVQNRDYTVSDSRVIIPPGELSGEVFITPLHDLLDELNETIVVQFGEVSHATAAPQPQLVTIADDDEAPTVALGFSSVNIPETSGTSLLIASLSAPSELPVRVDLAMSGTASLNGDYSVSGRQILIPPGETSEWINVRSVPDLFTTEGDETIVAEISALANATIDGGQATATIVDDTRGPEVILSVEDSILAEAAATTTITASLPAPFALPVTVELELTGDAGAADYLLSATEIVIPVGAVSGSATLSSIQDLLIESDESVIIDLGNITNGREAGVQQRTVLIIDDENKPTVTLSIADGAIPEAGGSTILTATSSMASEQDVFVDLGFRGSAAGGYDVSSRRITIPAGQSTGSISITAFNDSFPGDEGEEVVIEITEVIHGQELGRQLQRVAVVNDDLPPPAGGDFTPVRNSHTALPTTPVAAMLGFQINPATVTVDSFVVHAAQRGRLVGAETSSQSDGGVIRVVPVNPFFPGERIQATITAEILTEDGQAVDATVFEFRTAPFVGSARFIESGQELGDSAANRGTFGTALGDLDGDGDLDVFAANSGTGNRVYLNDAGIFSDSDQSLGSHASRDVALGDVDGDGDLDALVANTNGQDNRIWINDGAGTFSPGQAFGGGNSQAIALGDLDADGDLDVVVVNAYQANDVWLNDDGTLIDSGQTLGDATASYGLALGDLDTDGDLDVVIANSYAESFVWFNRGTGVFTQSGESMSTRGAAGVELGDVDGDGDLDALFANNYYPNQLFLNVGGGGALIDSGQVLQPSYTPYGRRTTDIALGDLDADGDLDAFAVNTDRQANRVWLNEGGRFFESTADSLDMDTNSTSIALGDLDGDGDVDAVIGNNSIAGGEKSTGRIWLNRNLMPTVSLSADSAAIDEPDGSATIVASLSSPASAPVTIELRATGTALLGDDFTVSDLQIVIPPGETTGTATVTAASDLVDEVTETIELAIHHVTNAQELGVPQVRLRIHNEEVQIPSVTLDIDTLLLRESSGMATMTVVLSEAAEFPVTVSLDAFGEVHDNDFFMSAEEVAFMPGEMTKTVLIQARSDDRIESEETLIVGIAWVSGGMESGSQEHELVIIDETVQTARINLSADFEEIEEAGGKAYVTATLSEPLGHVVVVDLSFEGDATELQDYVVSDDRIVIFPGEVIGGIEITAVADAIDEPKETVVIGLAGVTGTRDIGFDEARVDIIDDDQFPPAVTLGIDHPWIEERDGITTFTVSLSAASNNPVTVEVGLSGSASAADYTVSASKLVFAPGTTTLPLTVTAVDDAVQEPDETVVVDILSVTNGVELGFQQHVTTIRDDDEQIRLTVTSLEPTASGFRATLSGSVEPALLTLYDTAADGSGAADVVLQSTSGGPVRGSLIIRSEDREVEFVKSGDSLAAGEYTARLISAESGFRTPAGLLLDGDDDGLPGGDFLGSFAVAATDGKAILSVPDFVRGPGQRIQLPEDTGIGIPLQVSEAAGLTQVTVSVVYDPGLLVIEEVVTGSDVPAGSNASWETTAPGVTTVTFASATPLSAGPATLFHLQSSVPASAAIGTVQAVRLRDASINGGKIEVIEDTALHLVSFFGDVSGNRRINAADASQVARLAALLDSGFSSTLLVDPTIIGDVSGNGRVNAGDASLLAQFAALIPVPQIPPIPIGAREAAAVALAPQTQGDREDALAELQNSVNDLGDPHALTVDRAIAELVQEN